MIIRIWHGWTSHQDTDACEELLREEVFVGIAARSIRGFRDIELLRRKLESEVEFITIFLAVDSEGVIRVNLLKLPK